ncbi:MAG: hypothetical protein R3A48_21390 [Polyangiales bacterium]
MALREHGAHHRLVGEHLVGEGANGDGRREAAVLDVRVEGERAPLPGRVLPLVHRVVLDAHVEEPPHAAHGELAGLLGRVRGRLGVGHLEGDLFDLAPARGRIALHGEHAHVGRRVGGLRHAGEHVDRHPVARREARAEQVRDLGVLRRVRLVGAHRAVHPSVDDLGVRLGRHQPLVDRGQPIVTARRVRPKRRRSRREQRGRRGAR